MEELEKPETDIPSLFFAANRPINNSELKIAAHYLWVGEEKESDIKREETKKKRGKAAAGVQSKGGLGDCNGSRRKRRRRWG